MLERTGVEPSGAGGPGNRRVDIQVQAVLLIVTVNEVSWAATAGILCPERVSASSRTLVGHTSPEPAMTPSGCPPSYCMHRTSAQL